jgi:cytochrome b involved in lipid metabolism
MEIIVTVDGKKYDLTSFPHPAGIEKIEKHNGEDVTELFVKIHKKPFPHEKMVKYLLS